MSALDFIDAVKVHFNRQQENYDTMYAGIDYRGKSVIDIGAEYGTTARYFLDKGAKKVYAYEINPYLSRELAENFGSDKRVVIMPRWYGQKLPDADILKMDCERCEYQLDIAELKRFKQWIIAIHRPRRNMPQVLAFENHLIENGGVLNNDFGFERVYVKGAR